MNVTGIEGVDAALAQAVQVMERIFPDQIRAYYLHGSHTDGTAVATSDIDVMIVFKDGLCSDETQSQAEKLISEAIPAVRFDIEVTDEDHLQSHTDPVFKLGSVLIYGEDIRARLPLMSIEAWTRDRMHTSYWRMVKLFGRVPPVVMPLGYPDPNDEFCGYIRRTIQLENGSEILTTRDLIRAVGWAATGLVALKAGQYVVRKADTYRLYQQYVGDEWGILIEETYTRCKLEWQYCIPEARDELRDLCCRVLGFENHFLQVYTNYLLSELQSDDTSVLKQVLWLLSEILFEDKQVRVHQQQAHSRYDRTQHNR